MKVTNILKPECIRVPLKATDKTGAISELVTLLADNGRIDDRDEVLQAILAREQTRSTGIGHGLAVPHGKSHKCRRLTMAIGKPQTPIPFDAIDKKPCDFVVLVASPADETGPHIQALAGISRLWLNEEFRAEVAKATTAEALYETIERFEQ
jgi:fructose-specific phosphotransferase system IIA component